MDAYKSLLVPYDFSIISEYAFAHAINIAKAIGQGIHLIHISPPKSDTCEIHSKMKEASKMLAEKYNVEAPGIIVKSGTVVDMITEAAMELEVSLVVMGTHGIVGWQKFLGSRALKVIIGSKIPFIVVQDFPKKETYKHVIFALDAKKEAKEKIKWAIFLHPFFQNDLVLVYPKLKDSTLKQNVSKNLMFCRKMLERSEVPYALQPVLVEGNFASTLLNYAEHSDADLIIINTTRGMNFVDMLMGNPEQRIIANNAKIPVMVINPKPPILGSGFSASGT
jgi:nucleotide-binding universal stress UspA family protein